MATAPWLVLLITVIGTPLLGALLFFFVPLLREAKRLRRRLSYWLTHEPYWWVSQILVALLVGGAILISGKLIDDARARRENEAAQKQHDLDREIAAKQARHAEQIENLRFVRERAASGDQVLPFAVLDLQGQDLSALPLNGADFRRANLDELNFLFTEIAYANFEGAHLKDAVFTGVDLRNVTLMNAAEITGARFDDADFRGTILAGKNLAGAHFKRGQFVGADLTGADLTGADFEDANLAGADLAGADLTGATLTNANMTGANLKDADLKGVYYNEGTRWPVDARVRPSRVKP